ncbi:hypothetical protein BGZ65_005015 [Modicella reniformis]|uniref:Uncharacterized protein n=1 Tax=Modicella reniformis TaxID=1440133 RepID=A0A9P6SMG1_9FUNG|nr:hypothetical protein BGZ65_005015 [Modicella reniformis]
MHGHSADNLELSVDIDMNKFETALFEQVLTLLGKSDPSVGDFKAMFTALTGIVNLRAIPIDNCSVRVPGLQEADEEVSTILELLLRHLKLGTRVLALKCEVMLGEFAKDTLEGKVVPPIVPLIRVVRNLGELICAATTLQKRVFSKLFRIPDDTESGRKVDLLLLVDGIEVLNSEAKLRDDTTSCDNQYLKNLRINHAIHKVAEKRGLQLQTMNPLDIRGMSAMICGLQAHDGIFLGGAACEEVIDLPTTKDELEKFLSGPSPLLLWNYTKLLLRYQETIREQLRRKRSITITQPAMQSYQVRESEYEQYGNRTPPRRSLDIGEVTVFTPKKSKKRLLPTMTRPAPMKKLR